MKHRLADAVGALTQGGANVANPAGHAYELGKLLVLWAMVPDQPMVTTRGALGFTSNQKDTVSLPAAIDSAFKIVEAASPNCAADVMRWRSQKPWTTLVNEAIREVNAGQLDSATVHANQSLLLNDKAPYGYMVWSQIARRKNDLPRAIDFLQKTVAAARGDSAYNDVLDQSLLNLGSVAKEAAVRDTANAAKYYKTAADAYGELAADSTQPENYRTQARSDLISLDIARGDTAAVKAVYEPEVQNPSGHPFSEVMQAGVWASQVGDSVAAMKLFHAAYEQNPYHRDALSNLALYDLKQQKFDSALALLKRLKSVDPDGPNGRLWVFTYAGIAKQFADLNHDIVARFGKTKNAKLRKVLSDSATLTTDSNTVYTNLAVQANTRADSMPVVVQFSQFSHTADSASLAGSIQNNTDAVKTYTLKVDFLDKTGNVVGSQTASVGPVNAHGTGSFSIKAAVVGADAFKYDPLDQ